MTIPFLSFEAQHQPIRDEILAAMARVYDQQWYILGEEVNSFEKEYAGFNQVRHTVGVSSGLDALMLALRAIGIGPGHEVIVPSNTYIATWLAVTQLGASIVPVEPDSATSNLDHTLLEGLITPRTKAIIPVHLYGQACQMSAIIKIAQEYGIHIVEDNAQAQGASYEGQPTGSFGIANATSFYPTKNLGALGDAGAVTTNDLAVADRIRILRNYGSRQKNAHEVMGYNARLDELQAAILRVKLQKLTAWTEQRQQIAAWYDNCLADISHLRLPYVAPGATHVYHLYVVHTPYRDALQKHLTSYGIGTVSHYPVPPYKQPAYTELNLQKSNYPIAADLANTCLSLPLWPGMNQHQVMAVAEAIRMFKPSFV